MVRHRGVVILVAVILAAGIAWAGATVGRRLYSDYTVGTSLKPILAEGRRLVPVQEHPHMRGDAKRDYWCFSDGLCVYTIDVFRRLYPAYNDLDDEVLLIELRERTMQP
jgi:hypothetical protein